MPGHTPRFVFSSQARLASLFCLSTCLPARLQAWRNIQRGDSRSVFSSLTGCLLHSLDVLSFIAIHFLPFMHILQNGEHLSLELATAKRNQNDARTTATSPTDQQKSAAQTKQKQNKTNS
mmetsp:Transcript_32391/g.64308  ORF Transcript_32391/g.64308 Transcript_32391/m.64308 type:complete len:120 (+) Transcript_32391:351-710(+)